jgi:hypothetical protein
LRQFTIFAFTIVRQWVRAIDGSYLEPREAERFHAHDCGPLTKAAYWDFRIVSRLVEADDRHVGRPNPSRGTHQRRAASTRS